MAAPAQLRVRVLVAAGEPARRSALAEALAADAAVEVVAAVDEDAAGERAAALRPDVALLDVRLPGAAAAATRAIRARSPETNVVGLSTDEDHATMLAVLDAGAIGYLSPGDAPAEIVEAVLRAARGRASLPPAAVGRRSLVGLLVAAGEDERARIAGDIHDDSIQAITAAGIRLQILRRQLVAPEHLKLLDELESTIQLSISRLRHLLFELRPPLLDEAGLSAAVALYLEQSAQDGETRYRLDDGLRTQPPPELRTIVYRVVQEALTNVRKHARAREATVELQETEDGYLARISDDGAGFSVADSGRPVPGHLGLAAMHGRAALAGGTLRIESSPGAGTTVELRVPRSLGPDASL